MASGATYATGGGEGAVRQWWGIYFGYIAVNQDPLAQGRVKLRVPQVFGATTSGWASPMVPLSYVPKVGTTVTVMFVGGDPTKPVWFGNFALPGAASSWTISATAPSDPQLGAIWINSSDGNVMEEWNGSGWVAYQIGGGAIASGTIVPGIVNGTVVEGAVLQVYNASDVTVGAVDSTVGSNSSGVGFGLDTNGTSLSGRSADMLAFVDLLPGLSPLDSGSGGEFVPGQINIYGLYEQAAGPIPIQLNVLGGINALVSSDGGINYEVETWHSVTVPSGMTGTIRVKQLAQTNMACLDINVTISSTSATAGPYTAGALPNTGYYPQSVREYDVSVHQQWVPTVNASPRVSIPTSGDITLDMPGFNTSGVSCLVSGTVVYPLD